MVKPAATVLRVEFQHVVSDQQEGRAGAKRALLEDAHTGEHHGFFDVELRFVFLAEQTARPNASDDRHTELRASTQRIVSSIRSIRMWCMGWP